LSAIKNIFRRYIKDAKPVNEEHAVLSASGSERWLNCPGSVKLSVGIESTTSEWSIAGTQAHTLLQFILENEHEYKAYLANKEANEFKEHIGFSRQQQASVLLAADFVFRERNKMQKESKVIMNVEKKVELEGVGFGTADVILYQPFGILHVLDYKNGKKIVEPENNTQMLYYACGAADLYGWDFERVKITIMQPNAPHARGQIRTWETTPKRLKEAAIQLRHGAIKTRMKNPPLVMNSNWCWFCPARTICPEQMRVKEKLIMERFKQT
jgi:Protein of unknown function (DUF2800)